MGQVKGWALAAAILAVSAPRVALPQQANPPAEPKPAQIDRNGVLILIRSTLIAIDQANKTGNYTVLRDLAAPGFQAANTAARLGDIFANLRRDKTDLSGVAALEPQLSLLPQIEANGLMHMSGFFRSRGGEVRAALRAGGRAMETVRRLRGPRAKRPDGAGARSPRDRGAPGAGRSAPAAQESCSREEAGEAGASGLAEAGAIGSAAAIAAEACRYGRARPNAARSTPLARVTESPRGSPLSPQPGRGDSST
jgi:hypothetical protein